MNARVPLAAAVTIAGLALRAGCKGDTGPQGPPGPPGPGGDGGANVGVIQIPPNSQAPTDASSAAWAALQPQVTVQSVTISSAPVVNFTVTDAAGNPIVGLGNTSQSSTATLPGYTNLAFALAKLVPFANGSPSRWVSYIVTSVPTTTAAAAPSRPSTDNTGSLADHGDGTYTYTFYRDVPGIKAAVDAMTVTGTNNKDDLGDLTYDSTLVHRLTIQLAGNAPGTGSNTPDAVTSVPGVPLQHPVDSIYDFTPNNGQAVTASGRDMVTTTNCNTCHQVLGGIPGDNPEASGAGFHGGSRNEVRYCVVCHTEQRKYGRTEATRDATLTFTSQTYRFYDRAIGNLPNEIHKSHGGGVLAFKDYDYADVLFNEVEYPQDIRNCNKCHDATNSATPDAKNWMERPSRLACGACHDGIDFATGQGVTLADAAKGLTVSPQGHVGGIQPVRRVSRRPGPSRHQYQLRPRTGDATESPERAGNRRAPSRYRERQHQRGLDPLQPRPEAGRRDRRHLRHQERLGERPAAAGHGVPHAAGRCADAPQRLRCRDAQSGDRTEGDLGQLHGRPQPLLRIRGAAGRIHDPGRLQCHRQRLPEDHLE
jgi:Outer membrane cytochrome MtrC/MtrF-like, domains II/IV